MEEDVGVVVARERDLADGTGCEPADHGLPQAAIEHPGGDRLGEDERDDQNEERAAEQAARQDPLDRPGHRPPAPPGRARGPRLSRA